MRLAGLIAAGLCSGVLLLQPTSPAGAQDAAQPVAPVVETVPVDGVRLGYYTRGTGAPLLMINGLGAGMSDWDPAFLDPLAKLRRLVLMDNRGCGFSTDTAANETSIARMADDAAGVAQALDAGSVDVLGYSMGTQIAIELALRHPERVKRLILLAPSAGGRRGELPPPGVLEGLALRTFTLPQILGVLFPDDAAGRAAGQAMVGRLIAGRKDGTIPAAAPCSVETGTRQLAALRVFAASETTYEALAGLKVPVLVMGGMEDRVLPPVNGAAIAERVPFAWAAWFEGGHLFWSQAPEKATATVRAFLE